MKKAYRQIHTFAAIGLTAAFVLTICTACNKENKTVPTMATVSSMSSDIGISSLADSMTSSAVSSTASSSANSTVSKASSSSSSAASKSTGNSTAKPTGGSTVKPSGGSTTKPSGGDSTGGSTTKPSGGGSTGGGTAPAQPAEISTVGYESKYGCQTQDQYNFVRSHAAAVSYSQDDFNQARDAWSQIYSVPYSDSLNEAVNLAGSVPRTSGQSDNAYDVFASHNGKCDGVSRAKVAILQTHGYNAKVAYGTNSGGASHAWIVFSCGGKWYAFDGSLAEGYTPAGYGLSYTSYQ